MNAAPYAAGERLQTNDKASRPVLPGVIYQIPVSVNGSILAVDALYEYYPNNIHISAFQLSRIFADTDKPFSIVTGEARERITLTVNGIRVRYPVTVADNAVGERDLYLSPADLAMALDCGISTEGDLISFQTGKRFFPDLTALERDGFFQNLNALSVTDLTEDTVYYEKDAGLPFPIASISKLMTVFIVLDEIGSGRLRMTDALPVSENAEALSVGEDAMIRLYAGKRIPVSELLYATLVCSSNECALVLAENIAGSEADFVKRMREKAAALGMNTAEFVNCHGLPYYTNNWAAAKIQNRVSARDLVTLTKALSETHPEIFTFTSAKEVYLPALERTVRSTNPLLYNLEEVNGFKTGSTNKAGSCLITTVQKNGKTGAVVLLGAESSEECFRKSEIAARYLLNVM